MLLKKAHDLKELGNIKFQSKDFPGALENYQDALKLTPETHPDRAVFHCNKAACLMQIKPIDYDKVISECSFALQAQPVYVRALLRRARAFEALGKQELAMMDVKTLLGLEPNHRDALEIALRLRLEDTQSRPSPAALGASAVRGAPVGGLGSGLPARPVPKKAGSSVGVDNTKQDKMYPVPSTETNKEIKSTEMPKVVSKSVSNPEKSSQKEHVVSTVLVKFRPLKLVYGHDIRLAEMPVNCTFKVLREVVSKRFPSSKSVLIKFKDNDGDLVTIRLPIHGSQCDLLYSLLPKTNQNPQTNSSVIPPNGNGNPVIDPKLSMLLKKAHDLKELGSGIAICKSATTGDKQKMKQLEEAYEEKKAESNVKEVVLPCKAGVGFKKRKGLFSLLLPTKLMAMYLLVIISSEQPYYKKKKDNVHRQLEPIRSTWKEKGNGPLFLKAVNYFGEVKDRFFIADLMKEVINEFGHQNVVQIITNNATNCKTAGQLIKSQFPHVYWTPCVVHMLNLAVKNICSPSNVETNVLAYEQCNWIKDVHGDALAIKNFIMNHNMRLSIFSKFTPLILLLLLILPLPPSLYYSDAWLLEDSTRSAPHRDAEISQERMKCFRKLFPNDDEHSIVLDENPNDDVKMWDVGEDAFDSMEDIGFLEFANLLLDESEFENELIIDN
nr:hypothetical protein [Tanacetum cinerariifolium]